MAAMTPSGEIERQRRQKREAAARAVEFVESGMVVGLGGQHGRFLGMATDLLVAGDEGVEYRTRSRLGES